MSAIPVAKITDLKHINHIRAMLDDDGSHYDWSQDDTDALEFALCNCAKLRRIVRLLNTGLRKVQW